LRKRAAVVCFEGSGVKVDDLRKRTVAACPEDGVEVMACSGVGNEVAVCSEAGIEDGRWWRRCKSF
jgi:hypothetical protein